MNPPKAASNNEPYEIISQGLCSRHDNEYTNTLYVSDNICVVWCDTETQIQRNGTKMYT